MLRIIGLDPGLRFTGWGVVEVGNGNYACPGCGVVSVPAACCPAERLVRIFTELGAVFSRFDIDEAAVESVFVNQNGASSMKLCMARGVAMLVPALNGKEVFEYGANCVKKTVVGRGHASKEDVRRMVCALLSGLNGDTDRSDSTDALAIALCHAMHKGLPSLAQS
ncbi:MAG: crossover junction endodeoxyribonuclease RuvC [Holosporales bacterium]|nr:crossover junction endodeoxyribonuclease RuvC [Holosporales bacterium]